MKSGWSSKKDILKDLGTKPSSRLLDEDGILIGNRPPPRRNRHEDEEILDQMKYFGIDNNYEDYIDYKPVAPDYDGIQSMLRMLDEKDNFNSKDEFETDLASTTTKILISKLNPDVTEFKPDTSSVPQKKSKRRIKSRNLAIDTLLQMNRGAGDNVRLVGPNFYEAGKEDGQDLSIPSCSGDQPAEAYPDSLEKVNAWFQKPAIEKKITNLHEGKVYYKKRSPRISTKEKPTEETTVSQPDKFVPSEMSRKFYEEFQERTKKSAESKLVSLDSSINDLILRKLEEKGKKKD